MTRTIDEYAGAIFSLARETGAEDDYLYFLRYVSSIFNENPEYVKLLSSYGVSVRERIRLAEEAFMDHVPEHIMSMIDLLCEYGLIRDFDECVREYEELYASEMQISMARVYSAVPLTEEERSALLPKLEKISGRTVMPKYIIDESILGGVIVEMDGKVIDGSLKRRLRQIKEVMNG